MKPHHLPNVSVAKSLILSTSCSLLFLVGCQKEKIGSETESTTVHPELKEQKLAVLEFESGNRLEFRTESDGVVYDMLAPAGTQDLLSDELKGASPLKLFLSLTDKTVAVPEDLLLVEKNEVLLTEARKRGLTQTHELPLAAVTTAEQAKDEGDVCSGTSNAYDFFQTIPAAIYYRFFNNYTATNSGSDVYSSAHPSANKCNKVSINLTNCSDASGKSLEVKLYRKVGGIYYLQNTVDIPDGWIRVYNKSYTLEYYQKINIQTSSASNFSNKFGGYVEYYDYDK